MTGKRRHGEVAGMDGQQLLKQSIGGGANPLAPMVENPNQPGSRILQATGPCGAASIVLQGKTC